MSRKARAASASTSGDASVGKARTAPGAAEHWRALFGCEPPHGAGFIAQAIAWQEQVTTSGDVAPAIARDLAIAARQAREGRGGGAVGATDPASAASCSVPDPATNETAAPCSRSPSPAGVVPSSQSAAPRTRSRAAPAPLPPASSQLLPGTRLVKAHGGRNHVVEVTDSGFRYEGAAFGSLSAIARHITGTHWNGLLFFGLRRRKTYPAKVAASG